LKSATSKTNLRKSTPSGRDLEEGLVHNTGAFCWFQLQMQLHPKFLCHKKINSARFFSFSALCWTVPGASVVLTSKKPAFLNRPNPKRRQSDVSDRGYAKIAEYK
jgi:hypothetical protein